MNTKIRIQNLIGVIGLSVGISLPLVAEETPSPDLQAGAATVDISPTVGVSLDGLLQKHGPIQKVIDPLHVRSLVLDDGATRLAIVLVDACVISAEVVDRAKEMAQSQTGLTPSHVLIAATHTHMAPRIAGWTDSETDRKYYDLVVLGISSAIQHSVDCLAPAKLGWASVERGRHLQNRRWIMKPDTVGSDPFGRTKDRVVMGGIPAKNRLQPAGPVDPAFTILSVRHREDDRPLALLANFGIHYGTNRKGVASADYFGYFARRVEEMSDAGPDHPPTVALISNGASGDVGALGGDFNRMRKFGDALAQDAGHLAEKVSYRTDIRLGMREAKIDLRVRKPDAERLAWARKTLATPPPGNAHRWTRIFAEEALHLEKFPDSVPIKLPALRIGDLGIVAIPGEVFAATGLALRRESPFKTTLTISHANDWLGYFPTPDQHELGGMEVWPRRASFLERDASVKIREQLNGMLRSMTGGEKARN